MDLSSVIGSPRVSRRRGAQSSSDRSTGKSGPVSGAAGRPLRRWTAPTTRPLLHLIGRFARTFSGGRASVGRVTGHRTDPRVDDYLAALPAWQQEICRTVRDLVHAADPEIEETI